MPNQDVANIEQVDMRPNKITELEASPILNQRNFL